MATHEPVMVAEVLAALNLRPGGLFVDGTVGGGGHSSAAAEHLLPGGIILGLDWDATMLARAKARLQAIHGLDARFVHADYRIIREALCEVGREADGILLDLGLNNMQIEDPERGITFRENGPLDMRMDRSSGEPASAWLNRATAHEIEFVLKEFGDERWARRIAEVIMDRRKQKPLAETQDLVNCIEAAVPPAMRDKRLHPATRSFQAIRIHINEELDGLEIAIRDAAQCLVPGGTIVTLAYHSGEDRAAKTAFRELARAGEFEELYRKPLTPSPAEVERNPKSRSAKMRALRRIP